MKKQKLIFVSVFALCVVLAALFCGRIMSRVYYNKAQQQIKTELNWNSENPKILLAHKYLDKAIKADKSWWLPYWQKIQLYKMGGSIQEETLPDIHKVYDLWQANGNKLSAQKEFGKACLFYCEGDKESAGKIFEEVFNSVDGISSKNEKEEFLYFISSVALQKGTGGIANEEYIMAYNLVNDEEEMQYFLFNLIGGY